MLEHLPHTGRVYQHFRSFEKALQAYQQSQEMATKAANPSGLYRDILPLSRFLTGFFKENKQMGSKDRRAVSRYLYHYCRLGQAATGLDHLRRLVLAEFLCTQESPLVAAEDPELQEQMHLPLEEKIAFLESATPFRLEEVFPWLGLLTDRVDAQAFLRQFLVQPDLFLRMRRGQEQRVKSLLDKHQVTWREVGGQALALVNGTSLDQIRGLKGLVEVQDLSSQRSLEDVEAEQGERWWDACSGAGGKALLLMDRFPGLDLLVSDVRSSILRNLRERFDAAGQGGYRHRIVDLTRDIRPVMGEETFDGILLDVPCTGSGTWARTPEMLTAFREEAIPGFTDLQRAIASRAAEHLRPGKTLVYITCSVFREENEAVVEHLIAAQGLKLVSMDYKIGYLDHADTLFVAILQKNA